MKKEKEIIVSPIVSRADAKKLIHEMAPRLNVTSFPKYQEVLLRALGFESDPELEGVRWEVDKVLASMNIPLETFTPRKEIMTAQPAEGRFIEDDAIEVLEEMRKERKVGKGIPIRKTARVLAYLIVRKHYPHLLPRFDTLGSKEIREIRRSFCSFYRRYKPGFLHLAEVDTKYEDYDLFAVVFNLLGTSDKYWLSVSNLYPGAEGPVQYRESLMRQSHEVSELGNRAALRAVNCARENGLKKADYLFIVSLFFQACLECGDPKYKIFMPKPAKEWIAFGVPKQSFYRRLNELKKASPHEAPIVKIVMKTLPRIWDIHASSSSILK